jgi:excinuclease ABC subunit C
MNKDITINELFQESKQSSLEEKLMNLPTNPGIYQYRNRAGKIIYIGKAKNLRNRVRSYFQENRPIDAKTKLMVSKIDDLEIIVTDSEAEALILEDTLIKKYKPKYNILLRDDKTYPYIRITNEPYPRIFKTRKVIRDGSKYFGPFTEVKNMKYLLKVLRTVFKYRSCKLKLEDSAIQKGKFKICLDYHIKKCTGPCCGHINAERYNDNIKSSMAVLQGKTRELEQTLKIKMETLSEEMKFEEAAEIRNQLQLLKEYINNQKIVTTDLIDRDVIGVSKLENSACTLVFMIREGKLTGKKHYIVPNAVDLPTQELVQATLEQWYMETEFIPKEIFVPSMPESPEFLIDWLKKKRGKSIDLISPKLGDKKKIVDLACANAEFMLRDYFIAISKKEQTLSKAILDLQKDLHLPKAPIRIECFDNSHLQGTDYVSSMVVFVEGKPKKSEYRKFKLKEVDGNDDFAAMREVIFRRYNKVKELSEPMPELIIVDGGKGQLSSAVEILKEIGVYDSTSIIGLAKRLDEVFVPDQSDSILLPRNTVSLKIIQNLRDEAHRFAITYHRQLREKRTIKTELTSIEGVGEKTAQKLLKKYGAVKHIENLDFDTLSKEVNDNVANSIVLYFKNKKEANETFSNDI